jgi:hypothetical protein
MSEATHRFTRQELYELVWSEPMVQLAKRFGLSDVGLAKACRRLAIPVPERGYWAKRQAGKPTSQKPLPPRGPGMLDEVDVGGETAWSYATAAEQFVGEEIPAPPSFAEDIAEVTERVRKMVGRITVPKTLTKLHPAIGQLLEEDERRREKQATSEFAWSWDRPLFDSALERRRLRILNAIFLALARCGMKPTLRGREARDLGAQVGHTHVSFTLEPVTKPARVGRTDSAKGKPLRERLHLQIKTWAWAEDVRKSWEDSEEANIEHHIENIVVEMIVAGEIQYRELVKHRHQSLVERKAELEEQARRRKEEEQRRERERLIKAQKERVERLLNGALAFRQAAEIRTYVEAVRSANASANDRLSSEIIAGWASWALAEADRIDPVRSGQYIRLITDERDLLG